MFLQMKSSKRLKHVSVVLTVLFLKDCPAQKTNYMGLVNFQQKHERSLFHNALSK